MQADGKLTKKLAGGILVIVLLALCLCVTTVALVWESVAVKNNLFQTGSIQINLNDGKPVIDLKRNDQLHSSKRICAAESWAMCGCVAE